ncbi:hypothetical protein EJB05_24721, partial [Eragrostis curvula]
MRQLHAVFSGRTWPIAFSNHLRFYRWQPGGEPSKALPLVYDKDLAGEFRRVCCFAHCNGLVLVPTDTRLFLFNPATRDAVVLPNDTRDVMKQGGYYHSAAGLGLDPRTGKYKVVRSFYRTRDGGRGIYRMGMEVFTVGGENGGGGAWRETERDPPYTVARWQTAVRVQSREASSARGRILRLSLTDEAFAVVDLPDSLDPRAYDDIVTHHCAAAGVPPDTFTLDAVELWLTARTSEVDPPPGTVAIWAMSPMEEEGSSRWQRRCTIRVSDVCQPMGYLPGGGLLLWNGNSLCRCDLESSEVTTECELDGVRYQGRRARTWKNLFGFNVRARLIFSYLK